MAANKLPALCPCGSGQPYKTCCMPYCEEGQAAPTAEQLMRSRYTAFVIENAPYLLKSWHPTTRPDDLSLEDNKDIEWTGIDILRTEHGDIGDQEGVVEFIAHFVVQGRKESLHETSRFVCEEGQWFYLDGEVHPRKPVKHVKIGRNAPCPCGSGKKFKRCCLNRANE